MHTVCNVTLINVHSSKSPDTNIPSIAAELRRRRFLAGTLTGALGGLGAMVLSSCSTQTARADHAHPTASAAPPMAAAAAPMEPAVAHPPPHGFAVQPGFEELRNRHRSVLPRGKRRDDRVRSRGWLEYVTPTVAF